MGMSITNKNSPIGCSEAFSQKLLKLRDSFYSKYKTSAQKADRARNYEIIKKWRNQEIMYLNLWRRCNSLIYDMRDISPEIRYEVNRECELNAYNAKLKRKEENRKIFLTQYRYGIWFFSNSFNADYGTFTCSKCGMRFHHSPARIYLAEKVIYECCCGYCTNSLIGTDNGKYPYE